MKNLFLIFLVLLSASLSAVEYGQLLKDHSPSISIDEGDVFTALEWKGKHYVGSDNNASRNILAMSNMGDGETHNITTYNYNGWGSTTTPIVLVGPATIELVSVDWLMYKLERASEVEYKNINIVSLPSSAVGQGTHNIVVEASDDLQSWTPVHSSSIGGDKTFFRTRVVEAE